MGPTDPHSSAGQGEVSGKGEYVERRGVGGDHPLLLVRSADIGPRMFPRYIYSRAHLHSVDNKDSGILDQGSFQAINQACSGIISKIYCKEGMWRR